MRAVLGSVVSRWGGVGRILVAGSALAAFFAGCKADTTVDMARQASDGKGEVDDKKRAEAFYLAFGESGYENTVEAEIDALTQALKSLNDIREQLKKAMAQANELKDGFKDEWVNVDPNNVDADKFFTQNKSAIQQCINAVSSFGCDFMPWSYPGTHKTQESVVAAWGRCVSLSQQFQDSSVFANRPECQRYLTTIQHLFDTYVKGSMFGELSYVLYSSDSDVSSVENELRKALEKRIAEQKIYADHTSTFGQQRRPQGPNDAYGILEDAVNATAQNPATFPLFTTRVFFDRRNPVMIGASGFWHGLLQSSSSWQAGTAGERAAVNMKAIADYLSGTIPEWADKQVAAGEFPDRYTAMAYAYTMMFLPRNLVISLFTGEGEVRDLISGQLVNVNEGALMEGFQLAMMGTNLASLGPKLMTSSLGQAAYLQVLRNTLQKALSAAKTEGAKAAIRSRLQALTQLLAKLPPTLQRYSERIAAVAVKAPSQAVEELVEEFLELPINDHLGIGTTQNEIDRANATIRNATSARSSPQ